MIFKNTQCRNIWIFGLLLLHIIVSCQILVPHNGVPYIWNCRLFVKLSIDIKLGFQSVCLACLLRSFFYSSRIKSALFESLVEIGRHFQLKIVIDKKTRQIDTNGHFLWTNKRGFQKEFACISMMGWCKVCSRQSKS